MTSWVDMPLCAVDTETTSADPNTARLVTACVAAINGSEVDSRTWVANPGIEIPAEATDVHGITNEYVREHGRPHDEVVAEVVEALYVAWESGRAVVAYNASFDFTVIANHSPGFEVRGLIVDPFTIDREFDAYRKGKRTLADVCEHYGVRLDGAHSADGDALAAARLAWKMPRVYHVLALASADSLMESQANWYRERQYSYIDYLRRNNRPFDDVSVEWPVRTQKATAA
ncbi:3'-5' exonuclease [Nocardia flavorosea]|uniref:3'-5' exonuclease n=1 Tax=Nocardia flavorosea TaxID=53429 RepID=A0A846YNV0_9NOCA|nr:3'-5' exonuclease [Nocardia flavorosea]NKY60797.1 3'-5' exonuclease [Nocardia flavorosea]